ncbi:PKD domain-containing protein [Vibrio sp. YIC-376]|uniref:PKD domain-containing protein n=1 Tax=Vibrio sp. YIC-376 TaxID=3136162 RepID=UPI00402AEB79
MADDVQANLIQVIDTSNYPSPDPAGIVYLPSENKLLMTDSEINEMAWLFPTDQINAFKIDPITGGVVVNGRYSTIPFSDEPTGITINPDNHHCFISDDTGTKSIYEIDPGVDGVCMTSDDIVTSFSTSDFGSNDPEDVTYGQGFLYIIDGVLDTIFRVAPGTNGLFDGVDDIVTSVNLSSLGVTNPESIYYDATTDTLYLVDASGQFVIQITTDGQLVRTIDISAASPKKPSGITIIPPSNLGDSIIVYIAARGWDNDSDPLENDGKIYVMEIPPFTQGNSAPIVSAGADQSITFPNPTTLAGEVSDDGLPSSTLTNLWTVISGEGEVTFENNSDPQTAVSFSAAGNYVLRLTASDGELQSYDEVTINVALQSGQYVLSRRIEASTDDAEEKADGRVSTSSSDLELVYDGTDQTVGMRFNNIDIPQGATITAAYIQFQVDEVKSTDTILTIEGELSANAAGFVKENMNISSRPRTNAYVNNWSPNPWLIVGEAGTNQRTPDIQPIITEIISQSGWASGNSLAIILSGTGERVAEAYDGDQNAAPLLYVEYSYIPGNLPPEVYAGEDQSITLPDSAYLVGEVFDDGIPGSTLTTSWSKVSGEGEVTFTSINDTQTTASFSDPGDYVLRLTANDGELIGFDDVSITVIQEGAQILTRRVESSSDDAEEKEGGRVSINSSDLELVYDGSNQTVGMRFNNISIPSGATITAAYIQFQVDEVKSTVTDLTIKGEKSANATAFVRENLNISSRPLTEATVNWNPAPWEVVGEASSKQKTPDISSLIIEVISQGDWINGNSLAIIITGTGERVAESYDGDPAGAPLLYVEYTLNN